MELTVLFAAGVCLLIFWYFNFRPRNFPPGPYGLPLVGYLPFLGKYPYKTFARLAKKYGGVFSVRLGNCPVVLLNDWLAIKEALINQSALFNGRPKNCIYEEMIHYQDIIFSEGSEWKERRRFTLQRLKDHGFGKSTMETVIMEEIHKVLDSLSAEKDQNIELHDYFVLSFLNIIWAIVGGKSFEKEDPIGKDVVGMLQALFQQETNTNPLFFMPYLRYVFVNQYTTFKVYNKKMEDFLETAVDEHVNTYQDGTVRDYIDSFLSEMYRKEKNGESTTSFTRGNLIQIAKNLFAAGIETSNTFLLWSLLYMATWPKVQQKVQEELNRVVGRERLPTIADRPALKYTEAVLLETHRYSSLAPLAVVHTNTKDAQLFQYHLPKGTQVLPNLWAIHYDPNLWENPETFQPERFLDDKGDIQRPEYLIPFSAGGRACLGESLVKASNFLFFTCLLHKFSFSLVSGEKAPSLDPRYTITLTPEPFSLNIKSH